MSQKSNSSMSFHITLYSVYLIFAANSNPIQVCFSIRTSNFWVNRYVVSADSVDITPWCSIFHPLNPGWFDGLQTKGLIFGTVKVQSTIWKFMHINLIEQLALFNSRILSFPNFKIWQSLDRRCLLDFSGFACLWRLIFFIFIVDWATSPWFWEAFSRARMGWCRGRNGDLF